MPYEEALLVVLGDEIARLDGPRPTRRSGPAEKALIGLGVRLRDRSAVAGDEGSVAQRNVR